MARAKQFLAVTALAFMAAPVPPPATVAPDFSRPRNLPSLVTRWESEGKACAVIVRDGTAYILRHDGVEARDAGDGRLLWQRKVAPGECPYHWQQPLRVVDGRLLAGLRDRLLVVDRSSGRVQHTIPLGGFLSHLSGPPVGVVVGHQGGTYELLSVDIDTGTVSARRRLPAYGSSLASAAGTIVAVWSEDEVFTAHGLAPADLSEVWRSTVYSEIREDEGTLYGTGTDEDCACDTRFSVLEAASGMPSERRPRREPDHNNTTAGLHLPWDLQLVGPEHPYFDLRRNRRADGRPMWTAVMPGRLDAWVRHGDALFAHVDPGGRGLLLELDWNSGAVRRAAYGLRTVYEMSAAGDVIVLHGEGAVTGVSAREFGPSEADLGPVAAEVRRILGGQIEHWALGNTIRELQVLGPEALPVLADLIPSLDPLPLRVAALEVAQAGYHPAAPKLAARLSSLREEDPTLRIVLDALARIGGQDEVAAIAARLDPGQPPHIRFSAFTTLASVGTLEAVAALEAALPKAVPDTTWWKPASPELLLPRLGQEVDVAAFKRQRGKWDLQAAMELDILLCARGAARTGAAPGASLVVFPDGAYLGDLWAAELDESGRARGPAVFLGVKSPGPYVSGGMPITVRLEGTRLEIRRADGAHEVSHVDVAQASRDTDKDGIPDLFERRLFLDPRRPDTDGDGIADPHDPVPNARAAAEGEEAAAATAFFEQYYGINAPGARGPILVVADRALARYGHQGPTLVFTTEETERVAKQAEKAGFDLPERLSLEPADAPRRGGGAMPLDAWTTTGATADRAGPEERAFTFSAYSGPLSAAGYSVVMRKIGRRWYVRSFVRTWVS